MFKNFVFILGMLITMGGVGGVEGSQDMAVMIQCTMLSFAGLALMWAALPKIDTDDVITSLYQSNTIHQRRQGLSRQK